MTEKLKKKKKNLFTNSEKLNREREEGGIKKGGIKEKRRQGQERKKRGPGALEERG